MRTSYANAATAIDGMFFPAGAAWQEVWKLDPGVGLYAQDGLHASAEGTYTAALVIVSILYDRSPIGLARRIEVPGSGVIELSL